MPRVPTYESQILQPTIRQGEARAPLSVEQAAMPGRQIQEAGEAMGRIGSALGQYVLQQQELFNRARVASITNDIDAFVMQQADEYGALQGENALRPGEDGRDPVAARISDFDRFVGERTANLPPVVQQDVNEYIGRARTRFQSNLFSHFTRQGAAFAETANQTRIDTATQNIIRDPLSPETDVFFGEIDQALADQRVVSGIPVDATAITSAAATAVIEGLVEGNRIQEAQTFLDRYGEARMTPEEAVTAQNRIREAGAVSRGEAAAQSIVRNFPVTRNDTRGPARDRALREALTDENGNLDRSAYEYARTFTNRAVSMEEERIRNAEAQAYESLVRLAQQNPTAALQSRAFANLSPTDQERFTSSIIRGAPPTIEQNQAWAALAGAQDYEERIAAMTPGEIQAMRPTLGESRYRDLVADYQSLTQPRGGRSAGAQTDPNVVTMTGTNATVLRDVLRQLDLPSSGEEFAAIQNRARDLVQAEQQRLGRVLSQDELQNFLLQQMGRGIRSSGGFFAPSERPLATFRYRDIPRPDRDRIEAAFAIAYERAVAAGSTRSESYNPSLEENIVRQYIAEQRGEEIVRAP